MIGRKRIALPAADAKPEEIAEFRAALGVPDKPEAYEWKAPEGMHIAPEALTFVKTKLHGAHLTADQFKAAMSLYAENQAAEVKAVQTAMAAERVATEKALRDEWKGEFDANLAKVTEVAQRTGLGKVLKTLGVINTREAITALLAIHKHMPGNSAKEGAQTIADAQSELTALKQHPAWSDPAHPERAAVMKRRDELTIAIHKKP